jgi:prepilin-type N-terminal cleavage/methylation domain-containing protein
MSKPSSTFTRTKLRLRVSGFTLLEMLVATSILALVLVLFSQIVGTTMESAQIGNRNMDVAAQARTAFDRISQALDGLVKSQGATIALGKDTNGTLNDALAFITNSRTGKAASATSPRFATAVFKVIQDSDPLLASSSASSTKTPMLEWGVGTAVWDMTTTGTNTLSSALSASASAAMDPKTTYSPPSGGPINFFPLATNIFRFEISVLLSDGRILNTGIPQDTTVTSSQNQNSTNANPSLIALSSRVSNDPNKAYVKALIIGMAGISGEVRQLLEANNGTKYNQLVGELKNPSNLSTPSSAADGTTPMDVWNFTDHPSSPLGQTLQQNYPAPVIKNIRFYQRYYYVN